MMLGLFAFASPALADSIGTINFETYGLGTINAQDGWTSLGAAGSGCAVYDHAVDGSFGTAGFDSQSLRISNAVTSGCFGDQTFSMSLVDEAGETVSTAGGMSGGTRQNHFEAQFDFASTMPTYQPGLFVSVSPDRGDGSRMSYLGFSDDVGGVDVIFYDTPGATNPATFSPTTVANDLSRTTKHTAKFVIDYVDGPSNDVVKIYIDGFLVHTGTTWENYYRFDSEASAEQTPRTTDNLIFHTGGGAVPANDEKGFLFDNLSLSSGPIPPPEVHILKYVDGVHATVDNVDGAIFPMLTTFDSSVYGLITDAAFTLSPTGWGIIDGPYEASYVGGAVGDDYATHEVTGGDVVGTSCTVAGAQFALVGYTTGDTLALAEAAPKSTVAPSFTGLTDDKYVIVWNQTCQDPPEPLICPAGTTPSSLIETVTIPASASVPTPSSILASGTDYLLKAYGVANAGDGIDFDARYSFRTPTSAMWTDEVSTYGSGPTLLDLFFNGTTPWGDFNHAHEYWSLVSGTGAVANFLVNDVYYPNNTGELKVDIYACMPNIMYVTGGGNYRNGTGKNAVTWTFGGNVWTNTGGQIVAGQFELVDHATKTNYHFNKFTITGSTPNSITFVADGTKHGKTGSGPVSATFTIVDNGQGGGQSKTPDTIEFSIDSITTVGLVDLTGGNFQVFVQ